MDSVYRYLYYRVGTAALAEDLTSETFVRALRRIDSFHWQGKDIGAWFVTIARGIMLKGIGLEYVWRETLFLAAMAAVLLAASVRSFKERLE